jgi:hypothetical protein
LSEQAPIDLADAVTVPQALREWPAQLESRVRYISLRFPDVVLRRPQDGWPMLLSRSRLAARLLPVRPYQHRNRRPPDPPAAGGEVADANE